MEYNSDIVHSTIPHVEVTR